MWPHVPTRGTRLGRVLAIKSTRCNTWHHFTLGVATHLRTVIGATLSWVRPTPSASCRRKRRPADFGLWAFFYGNHRTSIKWSGLRRHVWHFILLWLAIPFFVRFRFWVFSEYHQHQSHSLSPYLERPCLAIVAHG